MRLTPPRDGYLLASGLTAAGRFFRFAGSEMMMQPSALTILGMTPGTGLSLFMLITSFSGWRKSRKGMPRVREKGQTGYLSVTELHLGDSCRSGPRGSAGRLRD